MPSRKPRVGLTRETIVHMAGFASDSLGLYISIPFCRSKCTYCNFASGVYPASEHSRYVDLLIKEMKGAGDWAGGLRLELPRKVDTIYLGGGTPSLLEPELIARLFEAIHAEFAVETKAEITVECAPGQLSDETLHALVGAGANRVSLGASTPVTSESVAAQNSSPVTTASTPGIASAAFASMATMRAEGCGEATSATCFIPGSATSAT